MDASDVLDLVGDDALLESTIIDAQRLIRLSEYHPTLHSGSSAPSSINVKMLAAKLVPLLASIVSVRDTKYFTGQIEVTSIAYTIITSMMLDVGSDEVALWIRDRALLGHKAKDCLRAISSLPSTKVASRPPSFLHSFALAAA